MKQNKIAGLLLIALGSLYLVMQILQEMGIVLFHYGDLWPLIVIGIGLLFEIGYLQSRRAPGLLIPGGIILTIGSLHLFEVLTNWHFAEYTWPIYVLAVGVGFFQYWLITKERWALVVTYIFSIITGFLIFIVLSMIFENIISMQMFFSILLIIIGGIFLFGNKRHNS